jgi:hypothetical protein
MEKVIHPVDIRPQVAGNIVQRFEKGLLTVHGGG